MKLLIDDPTAVFNPFIFDDAVYFENFIIYTFDGSYRVSGKGELVSKRIRERNRAYKNLYIQYLHLV